MDFPSLGCLGDLNGSIRPHQKQLIFSSVVLASKKLPDHEITSHTKHSQKNPALYRSSAFLDYTNYIFEGALVV